MKADLEELNDVSAAIDYLSEQPYSEEEKQILLNIIDNKQFDIDVDTLKDQFPGKRGTISRLRIIFEFAKKYQKDTTLMDNLVTELDFLIGTISGEEGGTLQL